MYLHYPRKRGQAQAHDQKLRLTNPPTVSKKKYPMDVVESSLKHSSGQLFVLCRGLSRHCLDNDSRLVYQKGTYISKPSQMKRVPCSPEVQTNSTAVRHRDLRHCRGAGTASGTPKEAFPCAPHLLSHHHTVLCMAPTTGIPNCSQMLLFFNL